MAWPVQPVSTGPFYISFGTSGTFSDLIPSEYDNAYVLFDIALPVPISLSLNFAQSVLPICRIAPQVTTVLTLTWISSTQVQTSIATLTFPAGQTNGFYTSNQTWKINRGDSIRLTAPSNVDRTISEISGTISALRLSN